MARRPGGERDDDIATFKALDSADAALLARLADLKSTLRLRLEEHEDGGPNCRCLVASGPTGIYLRYA